MVFDVLDHYLDPENTVMGRLLQVGERMQYGDLLAISTGKWGPCPQDLIGQPVSEKHARRVVRPAINQLA